MLGDLALGEQARTVDAPDPETNTDELSLDELENASHAEDDTAGYHASATCTTSHSHTHQSVSTCHPRDGCQGRSLLWRIPSSMRLVSRRTRTSVDGGSMP